MSFLKKKISSNTNIDFLNFILIITWTKLNTHFFPHWNLQKKAVVESGVALKLGRLQAWNPLWAFRWAFRNPTLFYHEVLVTYTQNAIVNWRVLTINSVWSSFVTSEPELVLGELYAKQKNETKSFFWKIKLVKRLELKLKKVGYYWHLGILKQILIHLQKYAVFWCDNQCT